MAVDQYALTSLANVKAVLEISSDADDALIEKLIDRASDWIENFCDRLFLGREHTEYLTGSPEGVLYPRHWPITSVGQVNYDAEYDWSGPDVPADDIVNQRVRIVCVGHSFSGAHQGSVKVVYDAGYDAVPDDLEHACIVLAGQMLKQAKADRFGQVGQVMPSPVGGGSTTFIHALPPDAVQILNRYRRTSI